MTYSSAEQFHNLMVADAAAAPVVEPCPRSNSMATVHQGKLFLYGGMFEVGNRQFTLNDFYSMDLHQMDQWEVLVKMDPSELKKKVCVCVCRGGGGVVMLCYLCVERNAGLLRYCGIEKQVKVTTKRAFLLHSRCVLMFFNNKRLDDISCLVLPTTLHSAFDHFDENFQ